MFYSNQTEFTANESGINAVTSQDNAIFGFASYLYSGELEIRFKVDAVKNAFNKFSVTLTDKLNPTVSITLTLEKGEIGTGRSILYYNNGADTAMLSGSFFGDSTDDFLINYTASDNAIYNIMNQKIAKINVCDNGSVFTGFPSGAVKLTFKFSGVSGESAVELLSLGGQPLSNDDTDRIRPQILLSEDMKRSYVQGEAVLISSANAFDVINTMSLVTVTVTLGGKTLSAVDGTLLNGADASKSYYIDSSWKTGLYRIVYTSTDKSGNARTSAFRIYVSDNTPLQIEINWKISQKVEKGKTIMLPLPVVTNDTEVTVNIYVLNPVNDLILVKDGKFIAEISGIHTVRYYIYDEYYNYVLKEYSFEVK